MEIHLKLYFIHTFYELIKKNLFVKISVPMVKKLQDIILKFLLLDLKAKYSFRKLLVKLDIFPKLW
jgi:hypothetical protein